MADFNERLIFSLEVNAAEFGAKLKRVISAATKNLTPELTVRSADIKFIGKVRAVDLFDLSGLSNLVAEAIKAGIQQGGAGAGINVGRAAAPGQLTGKALSDLFKTKGQATQSDIGKAFGTGDVIAKAVKQQNELTYAVKQTNSALAAQEKAQQRIADAQEKAQERMARAEAKAEERRQRMSLPGRKIGDTSYGPVVPPIIDVTPNKLIEGIATAGRYAANLRTIFLTLPIKFITNELGGVQRILQRIGTAASQAFAPVKAILGTLIQSSAILTGVAGSGFIFGGPAFLPVAGIRLATSALGELADQQHDTSLSVTQFSGEISKLSGADRVEFIANKFRDLSATIQDTAIEFGISTKEVSAGLAEILGAQVGVSSLSERLEALGASAKVAVGGATTVSEAFSGLLPIVKTFNVSFDDAADKLFAIQRIGKAPIKDLAPEIGRIASVAKNAGVGLDDLGSVIGTLTEQGVPLNTVITGISNIFVELSKGANQQVQGIVSNIRKLKGLEKFSIDIGSIKEAGGLGAFLDQLRQIKNIDPELIGKLFPDARAIKASLPAISSLNEFMKNRIEIMHSEGEASAANQAVQETLYKSLEKVKVAFSTSIVEIGNHISNLFHLKSVVDSVVEGLKHFTETVRAISLPDLKAFAEDLFTTKDGLQSLVDVIGEQFARIPGMIASIAPEVFRVVSVLGIASGLILARTLGNTLKSGSKEWGNISKRLQDSSNASNLDAFAFPFAKAAEGATWLAGKIFPTGDAGTSVKDAIDLSGGMFSDAELKAFSDELGKSVNKAMSDGLGSKRAKHSFGDRLSSFLSKVDAKKLIDDTGRLSDAMSQKLADAKPFGKPLIDDFTRVINVIKAKPIAISILGGPQAVPKALLEVDDMLKTLRESMIEVGKGDISIPTTFSRDSAAIEKARDAMIDLIVVQQKAFRDNPGTNYNDKMFDGVTNAVSEASKKLRELEGQGKLSSGIFDFLEIKDSGDNVRSQLVAVQKEWLRLSILINAGQDIDGNLEKKFKIVNNLRDILAARTLDTRDTSFNLDEFQKDALAETSMVSKNISDNFSTLFSRGFKFSNSFTVPITSIGGMSEDDLDQYSKSAKAFVVNLKAQLAGIPESNFTNKLRSDLASTISGVEMLILSIAKINPAVNKAADMGAGFDTILFTVESKAEAIKSIFEGMTSAIESSADATRRLADAQGRYTDAIKEAAAANGAAFGPQTVKESGFGQIPIYNDVRTQTFNVVPAAVGAVVRGASAVVDGLNAQNTPPK